MEPQKAIAGVEAAWLSLALFLRQRKREKARGCFQLAEKHGESQLRKVDSGEVIIDAIATEASTHFPACLSLVKVLPRRLWCSIASVPT